MCPSNEFARPLVRSRRRTRPGVMSARRCLFGIATLFVAYAVVEVSGFAPRMPAVVTSASYLSAESEIIDTPGWIRTLYGAQLEDDGDDGRRCAKDDKVFHRPSGKCFLLFTRGPCARYEWLVFDKEKAKSGNLTAVCSRRRCAPKWGFDVATGKCFEQSKCRLPMVFHYSLFGEGVCRCNGTDGRLATAQSRDSPDACYPLYHRAPCPKGQMVAPRYRLVEGLDAVCFRNPCDGYKPSVNGSTPTAHTASPPDVTTSVPALKGGSNEGHQHVHTHIPHDHHDRHSGNQPHHTNSGVTSPPREGFIPSVAGLNGFVGSPFSPTRQPFPRADTSFDGQFPPSDFEVEVMPVPNRPNLGVRTVTRAVVNSNNKNNLPPQNIAAYYNVQRRPNEAVQVYNYESGFQHGSQIAPAQRHGLPGFKITLTPFRLTSFLTSERRRRDVPRTAMESRPARDARGDANPRVVWDSVRSGLDSFDTVGGKGSRATAGENRGTRGATPTPPSDQSFSANDRSDDDYALQVQYSDGTRSCMSTSQLNANCDFTMAPLFSDFSELRVPVCVNALFRFAIGRVGKSEECVENDDGVCATKVIVNSPDPLDWELE